MAFDEPEVGVLFPVPFATIRLQGFEQLNSRLLAEIAERRKSEPGIDRSNRNGWHSKLDFFDRTEPAHVELAGEIEAMVAAMTAKLVPDLPAAMKAIHEGWVNVSPTHAMNSPHDHPGSFWSGTYYVHVPQPDDAQDKQSGAIEFIDPRGSIGSNAAAGDPLHPRPLHRPAGSGYLPNLAELHAALGPPQSFCRGSSVHRLQQPFYSRR